MGDKFRITLTISGKSFPLNIERDREEVYRRAEREINNCIAQYKGTYRTQPEEALAMAALQLAVDNVEREMAESRDRTGEQLTEIERSIDEYLLKTEGK